MTNNIYSVKNVKTFNGMEGQGFNCSLLKNGKNIGRVDDYANGGCFSYDIPENEKNELIEYCKTSPECKEYINNRDMNDSFLHSLILDCFIDSLINNFLKDKRFKKMCKTKTVFIVDKNEKSFYSLNVTYSEMAKNQIMKKFVGKEIEFVNERYK